MSRHQLVEGFLSQSALLSLRSHGRQRFTGPGLGLSKAIFGHESALGNFWSKGVPEINDHVCLKRNHILFLSCGGTGAFKQHHPLHLFILQPVATAKYRGTYGVIVFHKKLPCHLSGPLFMCHYTVPLFRLQLLIPPLSNDFAALHPLQTFLIFYNLKSTAHQMSPVFIFYLVVVLDCEICWPSFFSLPISSQPLKLFPENAGMRRKRKKTVLVCALQPATLHNIHWHTGVDCILSPMQTRCEVMYGSMCFFFSSSSQRKTDLCQKCSSLAILPQRCKNKF